MGYTHYWRSERAIQDAAREPFLQAVRKVLAHPSCPATAYECDEPNKPAQTNDGVVRFNGPGHFGCETFWLNLEGRRNFCKTRGQPYDRAVIAVLTLAHYFDPGWLEISSDGHARDWINGVNLARCVVPDALNPIDRHVNPPGEADSPAPRYCPYCGGSNVRDVDVVWEAKSTEEPDNTGDLAEYQCHGACEGRSFWA
jgi:hypothetical protein